MKSFDVTILGGGFAGGLLAWVLAKQGVRVLLLHRGCFGQFAIGESSTPMADLLLRQIGGRYDMPELVSLSTYPTWKASFPNLRCGKKRGFSYFHHDASDATQTRGNQSLLVTASPSDQWSDTHWMRSDIDQYLIDRARHCGAICMEEVEVVAVTGGTPAEIRYRTAPDDNARVESVSTRWLVNATGRFGVLPDEFVEAIDRRDVTERLRTQTRSTFAHLHDVRSWSSLRERFGFKIGREPFDADDAAQHHLTADGWMWMLRFDGHDRGGITSVGWTQPIARPVADWRGRSALHAMLDGATLAESTPSWISIPRVQRMQLPVVLENYVALPTAVATIDPLHSTGIAHGLLGVARLAEVFLAADGECGEALQRYAQAVELEVLQIDRMVAMAYRSLQSMNRFEAISMLYFAAAIASEEWLAGGGDLGRAFWLADQSGFVDLLSQTERQLDADVPDETLWDWLEPRLDPYQNAGLLNREANGMYWYTGEAKQSAGRL
ncbi:NAD(P)/FAD-dependent oxidoreductase [Rhodopirellula halodulae]|uniref:NAD(P)/FAD-dependent oxidoreductase n=1 Tax=Rhodopirellula halodulae TaxID=2894198 RepID=UPI001E4B3C29|nr:tryptophan 7-halogenase [Rhodopirellula sp. JC737]MCC9656617.1 tryptophan 7-halogenase [Rhodopirellula sp. JC737]